MERITRLMEQESESRDAAQSIISAAEADNRSTTSEEMDTVEEHITQAKAYRREADSLREVAALTESASQGEGRKTDADGGEARSSNANPTKVSGGFTRVDNEKTWGWESPGAFAIAVRTASSGGGLDPRFQSRAATTFGSTTSGADGGFAAPPDMRSEIMRNIESEDDLLTLTDQMTASGNTMTLPVDETTDWQTTGGILEYKVAEGATGTASKPALQEITVKLNKIMALVKVTEELLEDAPAMSGYIMSRAPSKLAFDISNQIIAGTGAGEALGILNSPALISVTKGASQVADTFTAGNVIDMWSRCYAPSRRSAVWIINQDVEPWLLKMSLPGKSVTGADITGYGGLLYQPATGLAGAPFGSLFGRPIIFHQSAQTIGDVGDVILADLSKYQSLVKGGIRQEASIHLHFDQDVSTFKFVMRYGGLSKWSGTVAALNGSATYSPFVTTAARA